MFSRASGGFCEGGRCWLREYSVACAGMTRLFPGTLPPSRPLRELETFLFPFQTIPPNPKSTLISNEDKIRFYSIRPSDQASQRESPDEVY